LSEIILTIEGVDPLELFGENNVKLNLLRKAFPEITITSRGNNLKLAGEKKYTQAAKAKFEAMVKLLKEQHELTTQTVEDLLLGENLWETRLPESDKTVPSCIPARVNPLRPKPKTSADWWKPAKRTTSFLLLALQVQVKPTQLWHWRCGHSKTVRSKKSS
jgi:phosphate starvation-inducible PhoH-like protein